jgi:hypothetical protein
VRFEIDDAILFPDDLLNRRRDITLDLIRLAGRCSQRNHQRLIVDAWQIIALHLDGGDCAPCQQQQDHDGQDVPTLHDGFNDFFNYGYLLSLHTVMAFIKELCMNRGLFLSKCSFNKKII